MTFSLALTQAPQYSYLNGGTDAAARQYYLRPTQHVPNGPRIAAGTAGMTPGEFRSVYLSASDSIFSTQLESTGSWYAGIDWTPRAAWDAATEQIIIGMRRGHLKFIAYSDVTGDWRELPMHPGLGRSTEGTVHYYGIIDEDDSGGVYVGSTGPAGTYRLDPATEQYTQTSAHTLTNGSNGAMLAWNSTLGALYKYAGDAKRWLRYDPGSNTWTNTASLTGRNGMHALVEYNPAAGVSLIVGGSATAQMATLVTPTGVATAVADCPQTISFSAGSWIAYHPAGCWLVRGWPDAGAGNLYACWPNATNDAVTWEDLGTAPDNGLTYSTAAVDYDREMIYIVSTTGLHAYKMPALVPPGGVVAGVISVSIPDATATLTGSTGSAGVSGTITASITDATASLSGQITVRGAITAQVEDATVTLVGSTGSTGVMGAITAQIDDCTASLSGLIAVRGVISAQITDCTMSLTAAGTMPILAPRRGPYRNAQTATRPANIQ